MLLNRTAQRLALWMCSSVGVDRVGVTGDSKNGVFQRKPAGEQSTERAGRQ